MHRAFNFGWIMPLTLIGDVHNTWKWILPHNIYGWDCQLFKQQRERLVFFFFLHWGSVSRFQNVSFCKNRNFQAAGKDILIWLNNAWDFKVLRWAMKAPFLTLLFKRRSQMNSKSNLKPLKRLPTFLFNHAKISWCLVVTKQPWQRHCMSALSLSATGLNLALFLPL